ncbi:MAG TPA: amidohydrolase family protein [Vicinamibacterales bacterium]|nr:amidohydrolase family protein [Vicinamibacterales bacterium]
MDSIVTRRGFLGGLAGLGIAGVADTRAAAQGAQAPATGQRTTGPGRRLPARGEFLVRRGYVLTLDPGLGDITDGDVHVRNGDIVAVGRNLRAPGASVLEGRNMIVMPGFVDTHWHMWTTYLRGMAGDKTEDGYFPVTTAYGQVMRPEDMYYGTRLSAAEAIYSGITTVNDDCHNVRTHEHAEQDIRALAESGLRGNWSYGSYRGVPAGELRNLASVERLHQNWAKYSNDGLLTLGYSWGGVPSATAAGPAPAQAVENAVKEIEAARRLGLRISMHLASREGTPPGQVQAQAKHLGKDMVLIHMLAATPDEMKLVAASGASISASPGSELRIGYGLTKACEFMDAGINVCVSVDTAPLTGNCHMFGILKLLRNAENAKALSEFKLSTRRALEMGTMAGARALGIEAKVGSLTPGKRADLIMIQTNVITMGVFTDPTRMVVEAAEPSNVDTVMIDGRILKRGGKLTTLDPEQIVADAVITRDTVRQRII